MSFDVQEQLIFKPHHTLVEIAREGWPVHVFVNPIEYHGPHLSLGNDRILSERVAQKLHRRLSESRGEMPFIVGGNIDFGSDLCPGKGNVGVNYNQLSMMIDKVVDSLIELDIKRVIFHSFHGSPFHNHAINAGVKRLQNSGIAAISVFPITIDLIVNFEAELYQPLEALLPSTVVYEQVLKSLPDDTHAGFFETSVALYVAPETVSEEYKHLSPCPELESHPLLAEFFDRVHPLWKNVHELEHGAKALAWTRLEPFPGYTGIPSLATAEIGRFYVEDLILPRYHAAVDDVLWRGGVAPKAPFAWSKPLSKLIGGRI
ncbi:MAG: creatininase family protein [Pseudomonadales bacterium]|nr:creatininase family protein [Pseudomonadales bacterium]